MVALVVLQTPVTLRAGLFPFLGCRKACRSYRYTLEGSAVSCMFAGQMLAICVSESEFFQFHVRQCGIYLHIVSV